MPRLYWLPPFSLALLLIACAPAVAPVATIPASTSAPQEITPEVFTAEASTGIAPGPIVITASFATVMPVTSVPLDQITPVTYVAPTSTPIPPLPGGLGPTELKYRVLAQYPDFFFCDPDYYPIAREDEMVLARQRFPGLQANVEEFTTILAHNNLSGQTTFSDDQILTIYRDHKKLAAIRFELTGAGYQFQIQVAKTEGQGQLITGLINGQGEITVQQTQNSFATCPICLAAGTLIDTPSGPVTVQSLRVGMLVWTTDKSGQRVARPVIQVGSTVVPASHQVAHLTLADGRELWVSPGHPLTDGRVAGQLKAGDMVDGAVVVSADLVPYTGYATFDLLPSGDTGFYWANGILIASTLTNRTIPAEQLDLSFWRTR